MDPFLTDLWLRGLSAVPMLDEASISLVRTEVRDVGRSLTLPDEVIESMAIVASELGHNQLRHAKSGRVAVRGITRGDSAGIEVVAADRGPGIADPVAALSDRPSPGPSLGAGIAAVRRLAHEVDFDVRLGDGTCVWARGFSEPPERRREVAVMGRAAVGETVCGDAAAFVRHGTEVVFVVADGLGHGPHAQDAALVVARTLLDSVDGDPRAILADSHVALSGARGAAATVGRLDEAGGLELAGVGNVAVRVEGRSSSRTFIGAAHVLGAAGARRSPAEERLDVGPREVVVAYTDGLSTRTSLSEDPDLLREPPLIVAKWLLDRFGKNHDDAMVLVIR